MTMKRFFEGGDAGSGASTTWLDFETTNKYHYGDGYYGVETSELDISYRELESITEVTDPEEMKQSILEELFPNEELTRTTGLEIEDFEANGNLSLEVEKYLSSRTGELTTFDDELVSKSWQLTDIPSPMSKSVENTPMNTDSLSLFQALNYGSIVEADHSDIQMANSSYSVVGCESRNIQIAVPSESEIKYESTKYDSGIRSPQSTIATISTEDEDWKPVNLKSSAAAGRKKYERKGPRRRPDLEPYPKNKLDRKKAQNRTAAWKYREKKKIEQDMVDKELCSLINRNIELKKRLDDMKIQMNCLMQLMIEAGMSHLMVNI